MAIIGDIGIDVVETGIKITIGVQSKTWTGEQAIQALTVLQDLVPRIKDIQKDKLNKSLMDAEKIVADIKDKIKKLG